MSFRVINLLPSGLTLYQNVFTKDQSEDIFNHFEKIGWEKRLGQEVQYYGYRYDALATKIDVAESKSLFEAPEITGVLSCFADVIVENGLMSMRPNQVTVVKYEPEHEGVSTCYPSLMYTPDGVIISVGSHMSMLFGGSHKSYLIEVPNGSVLSFSREASSYCQNVVQSNDRGTIITMLFLHNKVPGKKYPRQVVLKPSVTKRERPKIPGKEYKPGKVQKRSGNCVQRSTKELKPPQEIVIEYMRNHRGLIAALGTGSGKTWTAIVSSQCFLDEHPNGRVLLITPKSIRPHFKNEMEAYGLDRNDPRYCFYGYQQFVNEYDSKTDTIKLGPRIDSGMCTKCKDVYLIIDEAHNLRTTLGDAKPARPGQKKKKGEDYDEEGKVLPSFGGMNVMIQDPEGIRARRAIECASHVAKVLLLTATPLYNNPYDVENLIAMVKGKMPLTQEAFGIVARLPEDTIEIDDDEEVAAAKKKKREKTDLDISKLPSFKDYFRCMFYFHTPPRNELWPKETEKWEFIEMTESFHEKYRKVEAKELSLFKKNIKSKGKTAAGKTVLGVPDPWMFLQVLSQATNVIKPRQKIDRVMEIIKNKRVGEKIVVYTGYLSAGVYELKSMLDKRFKGVSLQELRREARERKIVVESSGHDEPDREDYINSLVDLRLEKMTIKQLKEESWRRGIYVSLEDVQPKKKDYVYFLQDPTLRDLSLSELERIAQKEGIYLLKDTDKSELIHFLQVKRLKKMTLDELAEEAEDKGIEVEGKPRIGGGGVPVRADYIRALRDYVEISGEVSSATERDRRVKRFNDQDSGVDIFILTRAGGEGLDLKGVRKVIMLESMWNRAAEQQVKGRASRIGSHLDLPKSQRNVEVIHLILTKPGGPLSAEEFPDLTGGIDLRERFEEFMPKRFKGRMDGEKDSADVIKMRLTLSKMDRNDEFVERLKEVSIEKDRSCWDHS